MPIKVFIAILLILSTISNVITLNLKKEQNIKLLEISGEAVDDENVSLILRFNQEIDAFHFNNFYLDTKEKKHEYKINFDFYRYINSTTNELKFDFRKIKPGYYYLSFDYKKEVYYSNLLLYIKKKERIIGYELLDFKGGPISGYDYNFVCFNFHGEKTTNLDYIIIYKDDIKYKIQTNDCRNYVYNPTTSIFDLACILDFSNIEKGDYKIMEFHINNKNYNSDLNYNLSVS